MNAVDFLRQHYPITAQKLDNEYSAGVNDVAFIMEKYVEENTKQTIEEFASYLTTEWAMPDIEPDVIQEYLTRKKK